MGKTATRFTTSIGTLRGECQTHVFAIAELYGMKKPLLDQVNAQIVIMDGVAEKHMPGGMQTEGSEELVEKDPAYIKAAAIMDAANLKIMSADQKLRSSKAALQTALKTLKEENTKFEKYVITKKAKWLGTKNSVPAAEACVKATKEYIDRCVLML
jgi:mannose/cellobiose epimerase-like protein (N-acyl-D-glucosamine 2-epimerase family)